MALDAGGLGGADLLDEGDDVGGQLVVVKADLADAAVDVAAFVGTILDLAGLLLANRLAENVTAFVEQVRAAKPTGVKGNYVKSITLSATMSPGIAITV